MLTRLWKARNPFQAIVRDLFQANCTKIAISLIKMLMIFVVKIY